MYSAGSPSDSLKNSDAESSRHSLRRSSTEKHQSQRRSETPSGLNTSRDESAKDRDHISVGPSNPNLASPRSPRQRHSTIHIERQGSPITQPGSSRDKERGHLRSSHSAAGSARNLRHSTALTHLHESHTPHDVFRVDREAIDAASRPKVQYSDRQRQKQRQKEGDGSLENPLEDRHNPVKAAPDTPNVAPGMPAVSQETVDASPGLPMAQLSARQQQKQRQTEGSDNPSDGRQIRVGGVPNIPDSDSPERQGLVQHGGSVPYLVAPSFDKPHSKPSINHDILCVIVEHLRGVDYDGSQVSTVDALAALAMSFKAVSDMALDALWSSLRDFRPVQHLLRCAAEQFKGRPKSEYQQAQWNLFNKYRHRIRRIAIRTRKDTSTDLWFLTIHGVKPIFPKLRTLYWTFSQTHDFAMFKAFITPSLETISITTKIPVPDTFPTYTTEGVETLFASVMEDLCESAPGLRKIYLHQFWPVRKHGSQLIIQAIATYSQQLEDLCIDTTLLASNEALRLLSSLPNLRTLMIRDYCSLSHFPPVVGFQEVIQGFPALRTLRMALPIRYAHDVLRALPQCALTTTSIVSKTLGGYIDLESFADKFGSCLEDVYLSIDRLSTEDQSTLTMETLAPLLSLRLTNLHIDCSLCLSDEVCADMAPLLTSVQTLALHTSSRAQAANFRDITTLHGLVPFAHHCPKLRSLSMNVTAMFEDWGFITLPEDYTPSQLTELNVNIRAPPDIGVEGIAFFLARIFPNVNQIGPGPNFGATSIEKKGLFELVANAQHCQGRKCKVVKYSR